MPPRPLHILLVENHEDTLHFLRRHLESCGHSVTSARSASEALAALRILKMKLDVLLCDIGLPDQDGWSLLASMGDARPVCCFAMSGYAMAADLQRSRDAGFRYHLIKPFLPSDLEDLLSQV